MDARVRASHPPQMLNELITNKRMIMEGKKVIVRCEDTSVFFGTLVRREGREVKLANVRKIWYWSGAASTFQLSAEGVTNPNNCKFTMVISSIIITDANEILPCTDEAIANIESVPEWKM